MGVMSQISNQNTATVDDNTDNPMLVGVLEVHFMEGFAQRQQLFDFLEASYGGGIGYKQAVDAHGNPMLIEHEAETPAPTSGTSFFDAAVSETNKDGNAQPNRYDRRMRIAAYENHVKPIIDKVASYVMRNEPKREESLSEDFERLELQQFIDTAVLKGLTYHEWWVGFDALAIDPDLDITVAEMEAIDPENKGDYYLVDADPRQVVDFEEDKDGKIIRVVIEELREQKASFASRRKTFITYIEWTADAWVRYELVDDDGQPVSDAERRRGTMTTAKVKVLEESTHDFGVCPWYRFVPPFPIEDIAELNRALFNMSSLLDEELYNSTFTQKYVMGAKLDEVQGAQQGTGNFIVIENPEASTGSYGATPGQSESLMNRVNHLRDAIYMLVSMENTNTKNVAEAAEKKKRDLEALYTMLVQISKHVEYMENCLLIGMGFITEEETDKQTTYDRKFDINSIEELQAELERLGTLPSVPPGLKRSLMLQLAAKLDPYGDQQTYDDEVNKTIDTSEAFLKGIEVLKAIGGLEPELVADQLGIPDDRRSAFVEMLESHSAEAAADPFGGDSTGFEQDEDDDEQDDDEGGNANPFGEEGGSGMDDETSPEA